MASEANEKVVVVGLGYVGLPVACVLAEEGFHVLGLEIDAKRAHLINSGGNPIKGKEPGLGELIHEVISSGRLRASTDVADARGADAYFVCVDTPVDADHRSILNSLRSASATVASLLKRGSLVSIESTIPPRTMQDFVIPILERESGMRAGEDFSVTHCPERVMPGKLLNNIRNVNRVLGGVDQRSVDNAMHYYSKVVRADIFPTDLLSAEISKTVENSYRDVQIAFANEVALLCEKVGADAFEVRRLVNTCPFRDMHIPGAGVGGYCLPKDSWLLLSGVPGHEAKIIPDARRVNESMPGHLAALAREEMARTPGKKQVAIMGLAFLRDSDDTRNSPAFAVISALQDECDIVVHDPFVRPIAGITPLRDQWETLKNADCAIFVTDHSEYVGMDLKRTREVMRTPLLVDGRNLFQKKDCDAAGLRYRGIGKG
jgi:UDP-N-acetyl-D-mannosaminuronic acid dehydrogenase